MVSFLRFPYFFGGSETLLMPEIQINYSIFLFLMGFDKINFSALYPIFVDEDLVYTYNMVDYFSFFDSFEEFFPPSFDE